MNEWVSRALVSVVAGLVSTGAVVATARPKARRPSRNVRDRRREHLRRGASVRELEDDDAADEAYEEKVGGMSADELKENVTEIGGDVKSWASQLLGRTTKKPVPDTSDTPEKRSSSSKKRRKSKERNEKPKDGLDLLKEEVAFLAKDAVKRKVVEASGMEKAVDTIQKGATTLREKTEELREKGGELGEKVRGNIPELPDNVGDSIGEGFHRFGRFLEGPGSQNYRAPKADRKRIAAKDAVIVDAKIDDDSPADEETSSADDETH